MLLPLPKVLQTKPHECARAAVQCILTYHGIVAPVALSTPIDGADPREIEQFCRRLGLRVISGEMCVEDVRHFCNTWRPPICLIQWSGQDSHYTVPRGVSRGRVYYHDVDSGYDSCREIDWCSAWQAVGRIGETYKNWAIVAWPEICSQRSAALSDNLPIRRIGR